MNRWQAVIFDLDDTLYPEREYVFSGMRAVALWAQGELGLPAERTFGELRRLFEGGVRGDTFDCWLAGHGQEAEGRVAIMVQVYRRHQPQIAPYPEVPELLRRLRPDYRLGLVTDGFCEVQQRKVAALNLEHHFQAVVYSDALGRTASLPRAQAWKPSPHPFKKALQQLSVAGAKAVYVGDNPIKDFRGARQLGMGTIRVRRPCGLHYDRHPPDPDDAPDLEIPQLADLETALGELPPQAVEAKSPNCLAVKVQGGT